MYAYYTFPCMAQQFNEFCLTQAGTDAVGSGMQLAAATSLLHDFHAPLDNGGLFVACVRLHAVSLKFPVDRGKQLDAAAAPIHA
jgi:hypothetical protein